MAVKYICQKAAELLLCRIGAQIKRQIHSDGKYLPLKLKTLSVPLGVHFWALEAH